MLWNFEQISYLFSDDKSGLLLDGKWGIERESQRVTQSGNLALTAHPAAFGNKMRNAEITTDFSESQLELITPPFPSVEETYEYLSELHLRVGKELRNELLWPLSMPPRLPDAENIPIARFDGSSEGKEKETYRLGLAVRYGKKMQMISGIHFNFSFGDGMMKELYRQFGADMSKREFTDKVYFNLARNFLRYRWLLIYLFGASPSIDSTYHDVVYQELKAIARCCPECCDPIGSYERLATSLRVSRFGYSNGVQGKSSVSFNRLEDYIKGIRRLMRTKSSRFAKIGIFNNGKQIQLNDRILQKESEFYSSVRLKQVASKNESQMEALEKRGVKYIEIRIMDVNPFEKTGISLQQMYFLQVFMLFCLFESSGTISAKELERINKNHHLVALSGRKPKLILYKYDGSLVPLRDWSLEVFKKLDFIASFMDRSQNTGKYRECIASELSKLHDPSLLPSARVQKEMESRKESILKFGIRKALECKNYLGPSVIEQSPMLSCEMTMKRD